MIRLKLIGGREMSLFNSFIFMLGAIDYTGIKIAKDILVIFMTLLAIAIIVVVLMQKGTNDNIGAMGGDSETYMGKNKGQDRERSLKIATAVLGGLIVALSLIYFILEVAV